MRCVIALGVILSVAGTGLATETYDGGTKTLTVTADSLASTVDPLGQVQDFNSGSYSVPAMTKDEFNALTGLKTITFNGAPDVRQGTTRIVAYYDATNYVTFSGFGNSAGYNYGGGTSAGRRAHSGSADWQQLGLVGGDAASGPFHPDASTPGLEALNWLKMSISVSDPGKAVQAIGFIIDGRDDQNTQVGSIWVMLSDASEVKIDYTTFGGAAGSGLFFGYQAPAGRFITGIEGTRKNLSGNSYLALDDLTFVLADATQPAPPAAITDLAASNPTEDSVTLTWTAPGDSGMTGTAASYDIR
jgi:hypothetical protein